MSYHPVKVAHLSHAQTLKLLKGQPTTVKHGGHHTIHMSHGHATKMSKLAHGKGMRLQLDPYAIDLNKHLYGQGFFSSLKKGASALASNPTVRALGKQAAQTAINYAVQKASPYAEQYGMQGALGSAADMASSHVAGMGLHRKVGRPRKHPVHPMHGKGMFGNLAKMGKSALKNPAIRGMVTTAANQALASQGLPPMAGAAMSMAGLGLHKRRGRPRKHVGGALYLA